jgi:uncharacterized protein
MTADPRTTDHALAQQQPGFGKLARIGVLGGISGGLLGGGAGVVLVPALSRATSLRRHVIHGTSTLANVSTAMAGSIVYAVHGAHVNMEAGAGLIAGGLFGVVAGVKLIARVPVWVLKLLLVVVVVATASKLLLSAAGADPSAGQPLLPAAVTASPAAVIGVAAIVGLVVGAWSATLGLGGALLTVPAMLVLFGSPLSVAEGTSLMVMLPNVLLGSVIHLRQGTADRTIGMRVSIFAIPGTVIGAVTALLVDARLLALAFGSYLVFVAVREILQAIPAPVRSIPWNRLRGVRAQHRVSRDTNRTPGRCQATN